MVFGVPPRLTLRARLVRCGIDDAPNEPEDKTGKIGKFVKVGVIVTG